MRDDSLEVVLRGLFPAAFLSQSLSSDINLAMCMSASLNSSFCKLGTCRRLAILSPLTLAGTPQWSGIAPTGLASPQRVSQLLKPALVHCLEVACGYCEAELSPALPGTPQRGLTPKGEGKFSGLELMGGGGEAASCPSWRWGEQVSTEELAILCLPIMAQARSPPALLAEAYPRQRGQETMGASSCVSPLVRGCQQPSVLLSSFTGSVPAPLLPELSIHWQAYPSVLGPRRRCGTVSG